jgi:ATP-dependent Lon protease
MPLPASTRQELLELDPLEAKLRRLIELLQHEVSIRELGQKITSETQQRMSKAQRDFFLREQLRSIQHELGEGDDNPEIAQLRQRLEEAALPNEARREAKRELDRLAVIPPVSPEYGLIRTYLDWVLSLPSNTLTGGDIDVRRAREVLDADHYDQGRAPAAHRHDLAMTGEITLRGKVLPVGGIKERVLAANRAGIRTVVLPRQNERDLDDVPTELRNELEILPVEAAEEVIAHALESERRTASVAA